MPARHGTALMQCNSDDSWLLFCICNFLFVSTSWELCNGFLKLLTVRISTSWLHLEAFKNQLKSHHMIFNYKKSTIMYYQIMIGIRRRNISSWKKTAKAGLATICQWLDYKQSSMKKLSGWFLIKLDGWQ
jgi:hypothetical protein